MYNVTRTSKEKVIGLKKHALYFLVYNSLAVARRGGGAGRGEVQHAIRDFFDLSFDTLFCD